MENLIETMYRDVDENFKDEREILLNERRGEANKFVGFWTASETLFFLSEFQMIKRPSSIHDVFLGNRLYLGQTVVTSFSVQFEKVGRGLLREAKRREGEWAVLVEAKGDKKEICRTKSTQSATLSLFFITDSTAVFTSVLQDRYSLFIPPPFG